MFTLEELNQFLGKAALATYAGGGEVVDPSGPDFVARIPGFKELRYEEGDFEYQDSYAGFFRSAGQEVVWYKKVPVWSQCYAGGMTEQYENNEEFVRETFDFLKKALSQGEKCATFQPRGPKNFKEGDWSYNCKLTGNIAEFQGSEEIRHKGEIVFTHNFSGGLLKWKD